MNKKDLDKKAKRLSKHISDEKTWSEIRATNKDDLEKEVRRMEEIKALISESMREEERELMNFYKGMEVNPYTLEGERNLELNNIHRKTMCTVEEELKEFTKKRGEFRGYNFFD